MTAHFGRMVAPSRLSLWTQLAADQPSSFVTRAGSSSLREAPIGPGRAGKQPLPAFADVLGFGRAQLHSSAGAEIKSLAAPQKGTHVQ